MGYPMSWGRLIGRSIGREGYAGGSTTSGDALRVEHDCQDDYHVSIYADVSGATEDQVRLVLAAFFDDTPPTFRPMVGLEGLQERYREQIAARQAMYAEEERRKAENAADSKAMSDWFDSLPDGEWDRIVALPVAEREVAFAAGKAAFYVAPMVAS